MNNILLTICARGGSKGVKGKNLRMLNGHPLIYYTIKQALNWRKAKHVIVSTDSETIAKIANKFGAEVPFMRPAKLAEDSSPKLPAIEHAVLQCEKIYKEKYEIIVDLDPTSPIRTINDLNCALNLYLLKKPESLFSVVKSYKNPYFNMVELNKFGYAALCKKTKKITMRRQDCPQAYDMNASIYIYDRHYLMNKTNDSPISDNSIIYEMSDCSSIDIDREIDFKFVEFLVKENIVKI